MMDTMLAVTDGLIAEVYEECRGETEEPAIPDDFHGEVENLENHDPEDLECRGGESEKDDGQIMRLVDSLWSLQEYATEAAEYNRSIRLLPFLLRKVPYKFGTVRGQVTPMIIQSVRASSVCDEIVDLQRLIGYIFARVYSNAFGEGGSVSIGHVSHKSRMVGHRIIRDCHSARIAQCLCLDSTERISYSYLGGGLQWDPPHGYWLVTRRASLAVCDRYCALLWYLNDCVLDPDMFWFVPPQNLKGRPQMKEMQDRVADRVDAVLHHLGELRAFFATVNDLLGFCGLSSQPWLREPCAKDISLQPDLVCPTDGFWNCLVCTKLREIMKFSQWGDDTCPLCGHSWAQEAIC